MEYRRLDNSYNSFSKINELVINIDTLYKFDSENSIKIHAKRKVTYKQGLINTNYLHVIIIKPAGSWEYYKENKTGGFSRIDYGNNNNIITETEQNLKNT